METEVDQGSRSRQRALQLLDVAMRHKPLAKVYSSFYKNDV